MTFPRQDHPRAMAAMRPRVAQARLGIAAAAVAAGFAAAPAVQAAPAVVTDIPPVHSLVAQVMEGVGTPDLLLAPGADAHHHQMRPSAARALQQADLVFWVGPEMTPWLERALEGMTAGTAIGLLAAEGTFRLGPAETGAAAAADEDHDHAHDSGDDHEAAHAHDTEQAHDHGTAPDHAAAAAGEGHAHDDHHGHHHDGIDPHAWLDPANARHWLGLMAEALADADPENAAQYHANATTAVERIAVQDARIAERLAPLRDRAFVTYHDAYRYFTAHYELSQAGTLAGLDAAAPGADSMRRLGATLAAGGVACVFPEAGQVSRALVQFAETAPVRIGGALDPEGATLGAGPALYPALIQALADTLADCLDAG